MTQCVVISDEITGGSAVGALLEKNRCSVCALMSTRGIKAEETQNFDCLVYSTNSRNLTPKQGYQIVFSAVKLLKSPDVKLYAKRIDPAMRGNTCSETQALLDALGDPDRVAIVVPAFPTLKRTNVGGYMLVDGKPVQKTLEGLDGLTPAESGRVTDLFTEKFNYPAQAVHLKEYAQGLAHLSQIMQDAARAGTRALVMDCTTQEEINLIADAVLASGIKYLAVDPGPFTATLARKVMRSSAQVSISTKSKIFGLIGGANPLLSAQVEMLRLEEKVLIVPVQTLELIDDEQRRTAEVNRVVDEICAHFDGYKVCFAVSEIVGSNTKLKADYEQAVQLANHTKEEALDLIATAYGQIAAKVLERRSEIQAIYSTGAEFTTAVCRELRAMGLRILGQVLPLTAYGEILGGEYSGMKYITSATSATATNTITDSIQYLKRKLEI